VRRMAGSFRSVDVAHLDLRERKKSRKAEGQIRAGVMSKHRAQSISEVRGKRPKIAVFFRAVPPVLG